MSMSYGLQPVGTLFILAAAVHELGYTAMPRAFVLPGSRALEPEAAAHLLGLSAGQR